MYRLVDPSKGKLNSFTFALMVGFFLQVNSLLPIVDCSAEGMHARRVGNIGGCSDGSGDATGSSSGATTATAPTSSATATTTVTDAAVATAATSSLAIDGEVADCAKPLNPEQLNEAVVGGLRGFFRYWRQFQFRSTCASVRLGRECKRGELLCGQPHQPAVAAVIEDPCEIDENTARTLKLRHLETLRAELNRAATLLERGELWADVKQPTPGKASKVLAAIKPYLLPALPGSDAPEGSATAAPSILHHLDPRQKTTAMQQPPDLPHDVFDAVLAILRDSKPGGVSRLPFHLNGDHRRALHHWCEVYGIECHRIGKQRDGGFQVNIKKPADYLDPSSSVSDGVPAWTQSDRAQLQMDVLGRCINPVAAASGHQGGGTYTHGSSSGHGSVGRGSNTAGSSSSSSSVNRLKTVQLLQSGVDLADLVKKHHLVAKHHPNFPLVQLSYSQTESNMASDVVQECRGLLLEQDTWNVVSMPFRKFFNHGEKHAARLDWATANVYEKLDGSIFTLYWYSGSWHVQTSKLPAADGVLSTAQQSLSFAELFWDVWTEQQNTLPPTEPLVLPEDRGTSSGGGAEAAAEGEAPSEGGARRSIGQGPTHRRCYMFELTTPDNVIIVRHDRKALVCIGARDLDTLEELSCERIGAEFGWKTPRNYSQITSLTAALAAAQTLNPVVQEGFVVVDAEWRRLKIKSRGYVALHHLGGNYDRSGGHEANPKHRRRRIAEIVRNNEGDEFLAYYPQLEAEYRELRTKFCTLVERLQLVASGLEIPYSRDYVSWSQPSSKRLLRKIKGGAAVLDTLQELGPRDLVAVLDELDESDVERDLESASSSLAQTTAAKGITVDKVNLAGANRGSISTEATAADDANGGSGAGVGAGAGAGAGAGDGATGDGTVVDTTGPQEPEASPVVRKENPFAALFGDDDDSGTDSD